MSGSCVRVGIVGGGVLGMTLALRLRRLGCRVTLIEAAREPGGLAAPQELGGFTWDRFYHVILLSDRHLLGLLEELGLGDRLRWGITRTGFFVDGRLYSLSNALEFLRFPPLSAVDKARLALTVLRAARIADGRPLEAVTAEEWLVRWSGRRTYERIWRPLLRAKLGENHGRASAAFIWAIIARMYAARRAGLKREMFGHVEGGYRVVLARLRERLAHDGVELRCGCPATEVRQVGAGVEVDLAGGERLELDRAVLTVPCGRIAALCPQLDAAERERLRSVVYQGVTCASFLLRRPLGGFYVTNVTDPDLPFTGVIEMTALVDRACFGGHSLVYLPRYLAQDDPFWTLSDDEIRARFLAGLRRIHPDLAADDVAAFAVSRVREVLAVSTLRYSERSLPPLRTSLPGVFVVNSAQIAQGTLNLNETVALANAKARELEPWLATERPRAGTEVDAGAGVGA